MNDVYVVKSGDSLSVIAQNNNTTVEKLMELNSSSISNPNQIYVGQEIKLPSILDKIINVLKKMVQYMKENTPDTLPEDDGTDCPKVKITLLKPCSKKVNLGCKKIGISDVEFLSFGKTDKDGMVTLKKKEVETLSFDIKESYYKDMSIQTSKDQEITLAYDREKIIKEISSSTGLKSRASWSTQKVNESKLTEHWCYHIIAIHHSGEGVLNTAEKIEEEHRNNPIFDDLGYHYIIGKDGTIYEGRPIGYAGQHVGANNSYKIGINFIGDYNDGDVFSRNFAFLDDGEVPIAQINSVIKLIKKLKEIFPLIELGGHQDYALNGKYGCPGNLLYKRLNEIRTGTGLASPVHIRVEHKSLFEGKNKC
jgi:murein DD-endopeptidase MepM/ murein hydrolase activator NlpD